jgi:hypothetical protein
MNEQTISTLPSPLNHTGLTLALLMPLSLLPDAVYPAPQLPTLANTVVQRYGHVDRKFQFISEINANENRALVLERFASALIKGMVETDAEIGQITRHRFFDMYEDF